MGVFESGSYVPTKQDINDALRATSQEELSDIMDDVLGILGAIEDGSKDRASSRAAGHFRRRLVNHIKDKARGGR